MTLAWWRLLLLLGGLGPLCGCTFLLSPIDAVPARRLPSELMGEPRADRVPIDLSRLRQRQPKQYLLDTGDVLAVYIEGVLGNPTTVPPVHFPEQGSDVLPAMGYPVPVREDGTVSLPLVEAIGVRGLTVEQAEERIRDVYLNQREILRSEQDRIVVSLLRKRTFRVIVVREDGLQEAAVPGGAGRVTSGSAQAGRGFVLDLPAYKNDVMHALAETGGLPGLNAKNEVKILRGEAEDWEAHDIFLQQFYEVHDQEPCLCVPPPPDGKTITRIALRLPPGETPQFQPEDVILREGDILYVESRETEVFYTGGLLPGGQFPLPRDYDLDVLDAIAVSGGALSSNPTGGLIGGVGGANPSALYVIRRTPCGEQLTIEIDLDRAIVDPEERLLVKSGDMLILRHTPIEESTNFGLATFFTYGVSQLLSGN